MATTDWDGYFRSIGTITQDYGVKNTRYKDGEHTGIDIVLDDPNVTAFAEGTVKEAGYNKAYGNYVLIDDGMVYTHRYAHLADGSITVKTGDYVNAGDKIGVMGSTGNSTGEHLHYEVRDYLGKTVNPAIGTTVQASITAEQNDQKGGSANTIAYAKEWLSDVGDAIVSGGQRALLIVGFGVAGLIALKALLSD